MEEAAFPLKKAKMTFESHLQGCCSGNPETPKGSECFECTHGENTYRDTTYAPSLPHGTPTDAYSPPQSSNCSTDSDQHDENPSRSPTCDDGYDAYTCADNGYDDYAALDSSRGRRTLYLEYWSRTDECKERKWDHLDELDAKLDVSREEHIFGTTLLGRTSYMEPNMFPYDTPEGIEHWTLWSRLEMNHDDVKAYVESWIDTNAPHVQAWNYDDNPERSINIFHVHVYLQVASSSTKNSVLQGRPVESLTH
ncbi:hypothetical protein, variant [Aphanomyces astaci]|nr:hypothetical protein, variant [Aphanomyces astaci]ETV68778.1 hypothetical protein, variant [Aphanomyces astaci]|eukprot:XP_009841732.1 hypothetical protein, variant [Aphanomyces astaci]